ncbi:recombinase RecT, partial [Escherichia coli]
PRVLELLLAQARTRNSTLWADDPRQQLAYLALKRWARLYCPEVILGVYTRDELDEPQEKIINPVQEHKNTSAC